MSTGDRLMCGVHVIGVRTVTATATVTATGAAVLLRSQQKREKSNTVKKPLDVFGMKKGWLESS